MGVVLIFFVKFQQIFLYNALQVGINCGLHAIAVYCRNGCPFHVRIGIHITVFPSGSSGQHIVIILFESIGSDIVVRRKTNDITGKGIARIHSLIFFLKTDSLNQ